MTTVAEKALAGEYLFFGHWYGRIGWPPDFQLDPVYDIRWPVGEHCLKTAHSGPPRDDIKLVWEPSRFALAFYLARAYARSQDDRFAQAFWQMFDAWIEQNPPMLSVAWGCGQESSFRLMAMLFAAVATLDSPAATNERLWALSRYAWQVGWLVDANINYARSQKNNHALSEATGLWTIGLMFPEFREAGRWRDKGRRILAAEVRRQIYDDGSYVQHSLNYHRVMMDDLLWGIRLGELHDQRLDEVVYDRFRRGTDWLLEMIDPDSGRVPNYGANDGANVLPLSTCDYLDYRPTAQAAYCLLHGKRALAPGPWDEKMLWLLGPESLQAPVEPPERRATFAAPDGGYYVLRSRQSWAMVRCHSYCDRPSQADMLHLDLWWRGINVLRDGGSYFYYHADPRWKHWFLATAAHNAIEVDGHDQMIKGPRFLWFRWTKSELLKFRLQEGQAAFAGRHFGYRLLPGRPVHTRTVTQTAAGGDEWTITDDISGSGEHEVAMRWRLCPGPWREENGEWVLDLSAGRLRLAIQAPSGFDVRLTAGEEEPIEGWESLYYGQKQPVPTLVIRGRAALPVTLKTAVSLT